MREKGKPSDAITIALGVVLCIIVTIATGKIQLLNDAIGGNAIYYFGYLPVVFMVIQALVLLTLRRLFFKKTNVSERTYIYVFTATNRYIAKACSFVEMSVTFLLGWVVAFANVLMFFK